jgi:hypothetical protein
MQLVDAHGSDVYGFYLRCLLQQVDFRDSKSHKDNPKIAALSAELTKLIDKPSSLLIIEQAFQGVPSFDDSLLTICRVLKLSVALHVLIALSLHRSGDSSWQSQGPPLPSPALPPTSFASAAHESDGAD